MKNFFKKTLLNKSSLFKLLISICIITLISTYITSALNKHEQVIPNNPLKEVAENSSNVPLFGGYVGLVHAEDKTEEDKEKEQKKENKNENNDEEKDDEKKKNDKKDVEQSKSKEKTNKPKNEKAKSTDGNPSSALDPDSDNLEIVDPEDEDADEAPLNEYFVTSIEDGEIVPEQSYTFDIKQLEHPYTIKEMNITVEPTTGEVVDVSEDYTKPVIANVQLTKGVNKLSIAVTYEDKTGMEFTVLRTYTVIFDDETLIIQTNITDQETSEDKIEFEAVAKLGTESFKVNVQSTNENGENEVKEKQENNYSVSLKEGKNKVILEAEAKGKQAIEEFIIHYIKPNIKITTNLKDYHNKTVKKEKLSFTAKANNGEEKLALTVKHNDKSIEGSDENYQVSLVEGKNTFLLEAKKGTVSASETYTVFYEPEATGGNEEDKEKDEQAPEITVYDIKHGETIKNSIRTFHVKVKNYKGESITQTGKINVTNNGEAVPRDWTDSQQISFTLQVKNGTNHIVINAEDTEGNKASRELTITGQVGNDGDAIGTATISVEATTVGLGYLVPPQQVEIYQGEPSSYVLDRLLKKYGYSYSSTGTADSRFYLAYITKPGLSANANIPADLLDTLEKNNIAVDMTNSHPDILGEFDFTSMSGWMYSVNGIYANVGFSDYYLKDGDVIRIRFTLAYGNDIGLGLDNFHKQW